MRYRIHHHTCYRYLQPVTLRPHILRLQPRSDGSQKLLNFKLEATPTPTQQAAVVETEGNSTLGFWFAPQPTDQLIITATSEVETYRENPFDYLAEPWAATFPIDYPFTLAASLAPYLHNPLYPALAPGVVDLAEGLVHQADGNVSLFLTALTQRIYETCQYTTRATGAPLPAGVTWSQKLGSCRDFTVLFMAACQAVGLAARFVSGYEEGDRAISERDLHAWAEVYVPGGGWRGFDPTHGLAVSNHHIALVASAFPAQTVPVSGSTEEGGRVGSRLETEVRVEVI
ncbi:MAG: transglutaminase family protein [Leptolyngbyaceae cyanobacterium SM2_3_12]|nr:transglutaminase family protein [Leptolyngbyaceae cyanobacterium SM2_3_12]